MGIELVSQIIGHGVAARVNGNAYKVLIAMATTALDKSNAKGQPPNLYFGGWEHLALQLGKDTKKEKAAQEAVRRAVQELWREGLIERLQDHTIKRVRRQTYRVLPAGKPPPEKARLTPPEIVGVAPLGIAGVTALRNRGYSPSITQGPRKKQEEGENLEKESMSSKGASTTDQSNTYDDIRRDQASNNHDYWPDDAGKYCNICGLPEYHARHDL